MINTHKIILVTLCAFAAAQVACADRAVPVESKVVRGGVVEASENTYDFGTVVRGSVVKHVFVVKNTGDQAVNIISVKAGCSCTAAIVSNSEVQPGTAAEIEVSFDTKGRRGFQSKSVKVKTDSVLKPDLVLTISGRVEPAVAFDPENIEFGPVARGTEVVSEVAVTGMQADGVKIESIEVNPSDDKRLKVEIVSDGGDASKGAKVRVTFKSSGDYGVFRARVSVVTSSQVEPSIGFGIYAEVTGDIVADTSVVRFPPRGDVTLADQKTQNAVVRLKSLSNTPFKFKGIEDPSGLLKVASTDPVDGGWQITIIGPLASEPVEGEFLMLTDRKGEPSLRLQFVAGRKSPAQVQSGRFGSDRRFKSEGRETPGGKGSGMMRGVRDSFHGPVRRVQNFPPTPAKVPAGNQPSERAVRQ